jgi:peptide/nickel transport system substrate-binding protein
MGGHYRRISRRQFLEKAGVGLGAGAAASILAGCGPAATPTEAPPGETAAAATPTTAAPGATATACLENPGYPGLCQGSGGAMVLSLYAETAPLDPPIGQGEITMMSMIPIMEGLWMRDLTAPNLKVAPPVVGVLAEEWEWSDDVLQLDVRLRDGVKFHDGTPWNAEAAQFNYYRIINEDFEYYYPQGAAMLGWMYRLIDDVEVVDDMNIRILFQSPFADFLEVTCEPCGIGAALMQAPSAVIDWGNDQVGEHPIGTGPCRFVERERGVKIVYERNDDYWDSNPLKQYHLDRMIFRPDVDSAVRNAALRSGEVDFLWRPSPYDEINRLVEEGFVLSTGPEPNLQYMSLNTQHVAMSDLKVRQALNYLTDREAIVDDLLLGFGAPWYQMSSPAASCHIPDYEPYKFDPEEGQRLLREAGYGPNNPLEFTCEYPTIPSVIDMVTWLQEKWGQYGIVMNLSGSEWQTYVTIWGAGMEPDVGMNYMGWGMNSNWWLNHPFRNYNTGHVDDPVITELLDEADRTLDDAERTAIYTDVTERDREMAYHVPCYSTVREVVYNPRVKGFYHVPEFQADYRLVWIEET